jgi:hypothetical protein
MLLTSTSNVNGNLQRESGDQMTITIHKHRTGRKKGGKRDFDLEFTNRVLFGFSISLLLTLILVCLIKPAPDYYGFSGFVAWTLGWLIASQKNVRSWSFWERGAVLAITAPVFVIILILFLSSFICQWCVKPDGQDEVKPTEVPVTPSAEVTEAVNEPPTITPTITPTPTPEPSASEGSYTVAIVDLMMVPRSRFGDQSPRFEAWNEYVEIYNYGESDVDLEGLWLTDGGGAGQPDRIVSWDSRFGWYRFPSEITTSSMILPAGEFGLILSGRYVLGDTPHNDLIEEHMRMGSIILTIAESEGFSLDLLGDIDGLECHTPGSEDFVVIYRGTQEEIESIVASYGAPENFQPGIDPGALVPSSAGAFPATCGTWGGVRISDPYASGGGQELFWQFYPWEQRSPGYE